MKNATPHLRQFQCSRIGQLKDKSDSYSFFNLLTSDLLFEELESQLPEHRERLYPPTETLSMFLSQAMSEDRSCQNAVNRHACRLPLYRHNICQIGHHKILHFYDGFSTLSSYLKATIPNLKS